VLCLDASRFSRNGRDWHHLLELCELVGARVIDTDGVYDPCRPNDRLLLGMKVSISESELGIIRARMHDAHPARPLPEGSVLVSTRNFESLTPPPFDQFFMAIYMIACVSRIEGRS
jgi:Resolvase, N terminal domain